MADIVPPPDPRVSPPAVPARTTAPEPWSRVRCQTCGAPQLLTERCPYCDEALELIGEFMDWVDAGGAER